MITFFTQDQVSTVSAKLHDYLEDQVETIAPDESDEWDFLHAGFRSLAAHLASSIDDAARSSLAQEIECGRKLVEAKEKLTRRGEFSGFRAKLLLNLAQARKAMRIFKRFGGWAIEKLVIINSAVNIYTLCQKKFDGVVEKLFEATEITRAVVQRLVKEVRDAVRDERQKKGQTETSSVCWRHDASGGGRHYQLPAMYNEDAAMKIERLATERGVMPLQVVEEAIHCFGTTDTTTIIEMRLQMQEELREAVNEMRDAEGGSLRDHRHIELERQLLNRDRRIADLEAQVRGTSETPTASCTSEQSDTPLLSTGGTPAREWLRNALASTVEVEAVASTWVEVEELVNRDQTQLLEAVKTWSAEKKDSLPQLLSDFLEAEPEALERINWVPEKLLSSALKRLSFVVQKITGENNLVDEPRLERIYGCHFVSLHNFGNRWEHWIFCSPDGKNFSVFGRDEFEIEAF